MIARTLNTPGEAVNPMTRNPSLKSALVVGSGITLVPIRTTTKDQSA